MIREELLRHARAMYEFSQTPESVKSALEKEFPELRESEDERIRKELLEVIRHCYEDGGYTLCTDDYKKYSSYLEKLKEHQNNSDTPNKSFWEDTISSSDNDRNLDELAREYIDGVKQYHSTPNWDLMQTAVCYGYHLREEVESECVESVKPAEWSEEDEKNMKIIIEQLKSYQPDRTKPNPLYEQVLWLKSLPERFNLQSKQEWNKDIIRKAIKEVGLTQHQINWFKSNVFPPKQKWSEEEKDIINEVASILINDENRADNKAEEDRLAYLAEKIQSLHPQPKQEWSKEEKERIRQNGRLDVCYNPEKYGLCHKTEWSEEDEAILGLIQDAVDKYDFDNIQTYYAVSDKLRSLRPQSKQEWNKEDKQE